MADARVVSNHLIDLASRDNDTLTPMQVLKLVYIAHGFSLGAAGVPLIPNRIEAWKYGPVIPDLYHAIKHWKDKPVGPIITTGLEDFTRNERGLVDTIYEAYRGYDGIQLSNLTHRPGTPWHQVYRPDQHNIVISDDLIQHHYRELFDL